jgi:hypothetical protein
MWQLWGIQYFLTRVRLKQLPYSQLDHLMAQAYLEQSVFQAVFLAN